jgi:lysozyme family protein
MENKLFQNFVSKTIAFETGGDRSGAYHSDPKDAGGETKWGISKKAHPFLNIKALKYDDAVNIYFNEYWSNRYTDLSCTPCAFKLFDMGVLMGKRVSKYFQAAINDCGFDIVLDGFCGPITIATANKCSSDLLYNNFINKLTSYIKRLCILKPWNLKFKKGWLERINYKYAD